jgi:hypothetical protein
MSGRGEGERYKTEEAEDGRQGHARRIVEVAQEQGADDQPRLEFAADKITYLKIALERPPVAILLVLTPAAGAPR